MSKFKIDALEVATSIHKGDFSKLRGKFFEMCDNLGMGKKYTLNQLGMTVDKLGNRVDQLSTTVDKLERRVDQIALTVDKLEKRVNQIALTVDKLVVTVATLAKTVDDGFKRVNARIDLIEKRLDYNNLKKLPESR